MLLSRPRDQCPANFCLTLSDTLIPHDLKSWEGARGVQANWCMNFHNCSLGPGDGSGLVVKINGLD